MGGRGRDAAHMARARVKRAPFTNARNGRAKRQVRWAFWMSRGAPLTTTQFLKYCYVVVTPKLAQDKCRSSRGSGGHSDRARDESEEARLVVTTA
jgi:hypothetical protein